MGSYKRLKGIEEISKKKLTYIEAIHVDEGQTDNRNWDHLWGIENTLLFDIGERELQYNFLINLKKGLHIQMNATISRSLSLSICIWINTNNHHLYTFS